MIFTSPAIITIAGWAITSYVITGVFFAEFASRYSNTAAVSHLLLMIFMAVCSMSFIVLLLSAVSSCLSCSLRLLPWQSFGEMPAYWLPWPYSEEHSRLT